QPTGCKDQNNWTDFCGNGVIDPGEQCDGKNLRGATCSDIDEWSTGTLACGTDCDWNMRDCVRHDPCGNGVVDRGEDCEPRLFDTSKAHPCADFPPHTGNPGNVTCNAHCRYDFSSCVGGQPHCGNGIIDGGEECDGNQSNVLSCWSFFYAA